MTKLSRTGFDGNQTGRTTTYACAEKYPEELLERAIGTMLDGTRDPASSPDACTRIGDQLAMVVRAPNSAPVGPLTVPLPGRWTRYDGSFPSVSGTPIPACQCCTLPSLWGAGAVTGVQGQELIDCGVRRRD